jgi:uncharacterized SAM-binding protein YcdF (DUF218 family)
MFLVKILLRILAVLLGVGILVAFLYGALFYVAYPKVPADVIKEDPLRQVDAIVFLAGESNRFNYAETLFKQGYAPVLYTPGGESPGMIRYIRHRTNRLKGATLFVSDIVPEGTYGEALNTAMFVRNHHIRSIILVTSPYHTYRAQWIFKQVLPGVRIISAAVPYDKKLLTEDVPPDSARYANFKLEQSKFFGYYILYSWPVKWLGESKPLAVRIGRRLQRFIKEG